MHPVAGRASTGAVGDLRRACTYADLRSWRSVLHRVFHARTGLCWPGLSLQRRKLWTGGVSGKR